MSWLPSQLPVELIWHLSASVPEALSRQGLGICVLDSFSGDGAGRGWGGLVRAENTGEAVSSFCLPHRPWSLWERRRAGNSFVWRTRASPALWITPDLDEQHLLGLRTTPRTELPTFTRRAEALGVESKYYQMST